MNGKTTIKAGDIDIPLRFCFPCIELFTEACAKSKYMFTPGENSTFTPEGFGKLLHCAYLNACEIKEIEPVHDNEFFFDWVTQQQQTEDGQRVISEVMKVYADSSAMKKLVAAWEEKKSQLTKEIPVVPLTSTLSNPSSTENLAGDPGSLQEHASVM